MSENNEPHVPKHHISTPNPAVEGESGAGALDDDAAAGRSGEYAEGDYGEGGAVDAGPAARRSGEYAEGDYGEGGAVDAGPGARRSGGYSEGDYGDAGTAHQGGTSAGQSNDSPEEQDQS